MAQDDIEQNGPWRIRSCEVRYDNPWVTLEHNDVVHPDGSDGIYGVVRFKNVAVGVLPIFEDGTVPLVGQHRFPLGRFSWELPEGGGPLDVPPLEAAKRELKEETGLVADSWTKLLDCHLSNSVTNEYGMAYLAKGLTQYAPEPEETEDLKTRKLPLEDAIDMALSGQITDVMSMVALQKVSILNRIANA